MVVGRKQGLGADLSAIGILHNGTGNAHAVKGGGSAPHLIVNDQALSRRVFENIRDLVHLQHKGGLTRRQIVRRTHAGKDLVHHTHARFRRRHEGADLRHDGNECHLSHIGGFTRHVGAGDQHEPIGARIQSHVVGNEIGILNELLHHGVSAVLDDDLITAVHLRADVAVL